MGMTLVAVLIGVTAMSSLAGAQAAAPSAYGDIVGRWTGFVTWPGGSSSDTVWTFNPDGTFQIQTDSYTANGAMKPHGAGYAFEYERNGQTFTGTLSTQGSKGQMRLVGTGDTPTGPMNIALTR